MTYDFKHATLHEIADWPVLTEIVRSRRSKARRLDSRTVAALYEAANEDCWHNMPTAERDFALAAIDAHRA